MSQRHIKVMVGSLFVALAVSTGWLIIERSSIRDALIEANRQHAIARASLEAADKELGELRSSLSKTLNAKVAAEAETDQQAAALKVSETALAAAKQALATLEEKASSLETARAEMSMRLKSAEAALSDSERKLAGETRLQAEAQPCTTNDSIQGAGPSPPG